MKNLIVCLTLMAMMTGCERYTSGVVTAKYYTNSFGEPMPDGICRYFYNNIETHDSCNRYNVGDTIR